MYRKDKKSRAVIAKGPYGSALLWYVGFDLYTEIQNNGPIDLEELQLFHLGLENAPNGISIWEGTYIYYGNPEGVRDLSWPQGEFRNLTEKEWAYVQNGYAPWDEENWVEKE